MKHHHDAHVLLTAQVAKHEHGHAVAQKDWIRALRLAFLWGCCVFPPWNRAGDCMINGDIHDCHNSQ
jgi:hypothetical protein